MIDQPPPIARAIRLADGKLVEQQLADHLYGVRSLAEALRQPFGAAELGYLAGLWHDLGKAPWKRRYSIRQMLGSGPTKRPTDRHKHRQLSFYPRDRVTSQEGTLSVDKADMPSMRDFS